MFDNLNIIKAYKLLDNITNNEIEVATFNAVLIKGSNINVFMNINYPNLYSQYKDEILEAYRTFNADVASLACSMELSLGGNLSVMNEIAPLQEEFKSRALEIFTQIIESLGDIRVNPVPIMEVPRYS